MTFIHGIPPSRIADLLREPRVELEGVLLLAYVHGLAVQAEAPPAPAEDATVEGEGHA